MKALAASAVALVVGLSACGSADPPAPAAAPLPTAVTGGSAGTGSQACNAIRQTITDVSQKSVEQLRNAPALDTSALAQTYRDGAATIRRQAEGADSGVRQAADRVADEFEKLGDGLARLAGTSTTPPLPDVNALTAAGQELQQACT